MPIDTKLIQLEPALTSNIPSANDEQAVYENNPPASDNKGSRPLDQAPGTKTIEEIFQVKPVWTLQLASFTVRSNAVNLTTDLQKQGFKAYSKTYNQKNKTWHVVYVGPEVEKNKLAYLQKRILRKFKIKGRIIAFKVE